MAGLSFIQLPGLLLLSELTNEQNGDLPQGLMLKNGGSGHLVASVPPVKNTNMYEGRIKGPTGDWLTSVFTGDSQHIIFSGLKPGVTYTAQVRCLGGATGQ